MRILLLLILLLFLSCSEQAGGTGTETTNGFVALSDGSPAAGAVVRVRRSTQWYDAVSKGESTLLDSVICDEKGFYDFGILYDESHIYEVTHGDERGFEALSITDTLHLEQGVSLSGAVPTGVTNVLLGGTDYVAAVVQDSFQFSSLPQGYFPLFYQQESSLALATTLTLDESDTKIDAVDYGGILFNDFVAGFDRSPLDYITSTIHWYTYSDSCSKSFRDGEWVLKTLSEHGGKTSVDPVAENGVLNLTVNLKDGWDYPFGGVGAVLYRDGRGYNLESMDTLTLRARGTGIMRVALESELFDEISNTHYGVLCTLSTNWKEFLIPVSDLHIYNQDSVHEETHPWSSISREIHRLECGFLNAHNAVEQELHLELDWLVFGGMTIEDL